MRNPRIRNPSYPQPAYPQPTYAQPAPQAYAPPPAVAPAQPDTISQLKQLAELRDQGILTDEEFAGAKAKVLAAP